MVLQLSLCYSMGPVGDVVCFTPHGGKPLGGETDYISLIPIPGTWKRYIIAHLT